MDALLAKRQLVPRGLLRVHCVELGLVCAHGQHVDHHKRYISVISVFALTFLAGGFLAAAFFPAGLATPVAAAAAAVGTFVRPDLRGGMLLDLSWIC